MSNPSIDAQRLGLILNDLRLPAKRAQSLGRHEGDVGAVDAHLSRVGAVEAPIGPLVWLRWKMIHCTPIPRLCRPTILVILSAML